MQRQFLPSRSFHFGGDQKNDDKRLTATSCGTSRQAIQGYVRERLNPEGSIKETALTMDRILVNRDGGHSRQRGKCDQNQRDMVYCFPRGAVTKYHKLSGLT